MNPVLQPAQSRSRRARERRRRIFTRALPIAVIAGAAFLTGAISGRQQTDLDAARTFMAAWERGDYGTMHDQLSDDAAAKYPLSAFREAYEQAAEAATIKQVGEDSLDSGETPTGGKAAVARGHPDDERVRQPGRAARPAARRRPRSTGTQPWCFPGLESGESVAHRTRVPERAAILASRRHPARRGPGHGPHVVARKLRRGRRRRGRDPKRGGARAAAEAGLSGRHADRNERARAGVQRPPPRHARR